MEGREQSTTPIPVPARITSGKDLRALRENLNVTQAEFAELLGTTKSNLSQKEWKNSAVSLELGAAALAVARAVRVGRAILATPKKGKDALHSKNFSVPAPFSVLPTVCPICKKAECRPKPVRDLEQDGQRFWVFSGASCNKSFCLCETGQFAGTPDSLARPAVLRKFCYACGRLRVITKKFRSRLDCDVIELRCRRTKGDTPNQKHDPPEFIRADRGRIRLLTAAELDNLHDRNRHNFAVPRCEKDDCVGFGKRMQRSGLRLRQIVAFVCATANPRHYAFRHNPAGEVVHKLADGFYQWEDSKTGELRVLKSNLKHERHPRRHPAPPTVMCPDHPRNVLKRSYGPWTDRNTRKLRWGYGRCPSDSNEHPGWTCSHGEQPRMVVPRPKRRWQEGQRRLSESRRSWGRAQYRTLLAELQRVHASAESIRNSQFSDARKLQLIEEHRVSQSFKLLGNYWRAFLRFADGLVPRTNTWRPSEAAIALLAERCGVTEETFRRKVLRSA